MQSQNQQMPYGMFQDDAAKIQRRRELLAGVMAQAQPRQGQMVGGQYIRGNGLGQVAALIAGAMMGKDKTPEMEETARARYQQSLREGLTGYLDQRNGRAGGVMDDQQAQNLMENDIAPQLAEPIKANPREAVIGAMSSRHPELRALGTADLTHMQKSGVDVKDLLAYTDPKAIPQLLAGGTAAFQPKQGKVSTEDVSIGNGMWQTFETDEYGRVLQDKPLGQPFAKRATASDTTVTVGGGDAVPKDLAKALPDRFERLQTTATTAVQQIQSADRIERLATDPQIVAGALAQPQLFAQSIAAKLGFTGSDGVAKTQALFREAAQATLATVKQLPGAISEKELPFLAGAAAGQMDFTPEAIAHIARLQKAAAHNTLMQTYRNYDSASQLAGGEAYQKAYPLPMQGSYQLDPKVYEVGETNMAAVRDVPGGAKQTPAANPSAQKGTAANPLTWDEYMARQRGGR
jgi:hypothetical protein